MIELKHSSIVVHGYTMGKCRKLEYMFSVWDPARFKADPYFLYDEENKRLILPRGFSVDYLAYLFPDKEIRVNRKPDESRRAIFTLTAKARDDDQVRAIEFLLGGEEYPESAESSQRMLCLATGKGKTFCTIAALSEIRRRAMVIVNSDKLMKQWTEEFLKFTNLSRSEIFWVSGSDSIRKLMKVRSDVRYKVFIAKHQTLQAYAGDDWSRVTDFFKKIKIGVKVFDEAHLQWETLLMTDYHTNTELTFYLTATPGRSDPKQNEVYQRAFQKVPKHGLEEKFDDPYHNIWYISWDSRPTPKDQADCQTKRGFNANAYSDYLFNKRYDEFFGIVKKILDITTRKKGKTAIILKKNEHISILAEDLARVYGADKIGVFTTLVKDGEARSRELEKKIILSTEKSFGVAIDVDMLRFLIMTVPSSSKIVAEQTLGRLRKLRDGLKSFYFDLTDVGFGQCVIQRRHRRKILDQKAATIRLLKM